MLGPEKPVALHSSCLHAGNYVPSAEKWSRAIAIQKQLLDITKRVMSPQHHFALIYTNNVALAYGLQGQCEKSVLLNKCRDLQGDGRFQASQHCDKHITPCKVFEVPRPAASCYSSNVAMFPTPPGILGLDHDHQDIVEATNCLTAWQNTSK